MKKVLMYCFMVFGLAMAKNVDKYTADDFYNAMCHSYAVKTYERKASDTAEEIKDGKSFLTPKVKKSFKTPKQKDVLKLIEKTNKVYEAELDLYKSFIKICKRHYKKK